MKTTVTITAGACGFTTKASADFDPATGMCKLEISTPCPHFGKVAAELDAVAPGEEFDWAKSHIHNKMHALCSHTACPVPAGLVKAVQVACGKKSPVNASITFDGVQS